APAARLRGARRDGGGHRHRSLAGHHTRGPSPSAEPSPPRQRNTHRNRSVAAHRAKASFAALPETPGLSLSGRTQPAAGSVPLGGSDAAALPRLAPTAPAAL